MITHEGTELKPGDVIEAGKFMAHLVDDEVLLEVYKVRTNIGKPRSTQVEFNATYLGAHLGKTKCIVTEEKVKWSWLS